MVNTEEPTQIFEIPPTEEIEEGSLRVTAGIDEPLTGCEYDAVLDRLTGYFGRDVHSNAYSHTFRPIGGRDPFQRSGTTRVYHREGSTIVLRAVKKELLNTGELSVILEPHGDDSTRNLARKISMLNPHLRLDDRVK